MAILNNSRVEEYNKIQAVIYEVINNRKFKFDIDTILDVIKKKALLLNINNSLLDCSYFYILVLNTLDEFMDTGRIYKMEHEYIPADFLVCTTYFPSPSRLLYYITNNEDTKEEEKFIDIDNLEVVSYDMIKSSDFVLCGGCKKNVDDEYKIILQTDVTLEEITNLYHDLIREGASNEEAIIHLLNFYKIQSMPRNLIFANEFTFQKPQVKKLSRKKIIHK